MPSSAAFLGRLPGALAYLASASLILFALTGCARVKPYQREHLARRSMTQPRSDGELRFEQHARGSREGADGGSGEAGGGCGCN